MKKRGSDSPDRADALKALSCYLGKIRNIQAVRQRKISRRACKGQLLEKV